VRWRRWLAPLPGCVDLRIRDPVVSLRSTTGYKLKSLRLEEISFVGLQISRSRRDYGLLRMIRKRSLGIARSPIPAGIKACSRWSSAATPPDSSRILILTPAGVPASIEIPFVIIHPGLLEKFDQLLSERLMPMMFLLIGDVYPDGRFHRLAHREGGISLLPPE